MVQKLDERTIYQAISETKASDFLRGHLENRGAYFTHLIMKYAAEQGIQLNPHWQAKNKEEIFRKLKAETDAQMSQKSHLYVGARPEEYEAAWLRQFEQITGNAGYSREGFQPFLKTNGSSNSDSQKIGQ